MGEGGSSLFATPHKRTSLKLSCMCERNIMYTAPYHELKYKCKNGWESWVCPWAKLSGLKGAAEIFDKRKRISLCHSFHLTLRFYVKIGTPKIANFTYQVSLPQGLTCSQCVVQWTYTTGNTWGKCDNGTEAIGCGPQVSKAPKITTLYDSRVPKGVLQYT